MNYIPLKINGKHLCEIFTPEAVQGMTANEMVQYSLEHCMYPSEVHIESETYSRNAERTADYELLNLLLVNRKAKPSFTWDLLKLEYLQKLLTYLNYTYNFKDAAGVIMPKEADDITVTYYDITGERTIKAYLGQTISCQIVVCEEELFVRNLELAFPER